MSQHTSGNVRADGTDIRSEDGGALIAECHTEDFYLVEAEVNAARLALCWNMHDEMRESLRACLRFIDDLDGTSPSDTDDVIKARTILKKTGEGK